MTTYVISNPVMGAWGRHKFKKGQKVYVYDAGASAGMEFTDIAVVAFGPFYVAGSATTAHYLIRYTRCGGPRWRGGIEHKHACVTDFVAFPEDKLRKVK